MLKKILQSICLVLVIALLGISVFCFALTEKGKTTILIVPGVVASTLVQGEEEKPIWDPYNSEHSIKEYLDGEIFNMAWDLAFGSKYSGITMPILQDILDNSENSLLKQLSADENGNYRDNGIHAANMQSEPNLRYGVFLCHKELYDNLYKAYGDTCNVDIFQYDWRKDNRESGKALEDYINEKNYNNVIFVAHSMGNIVTSSYLSRSQENRDKVKGFCSIAAPYYGSMITLGLLENLMGRVEPIINMLEENPFVLNLLQITMDDVMDIIDDQVLPLVNNLVTVAQMLPTIEYAQNLKTYYGSSFLTVDGQDILTQQQLTDFYCSRPWALKADGTVKPVISDLVNYNNSFYVEQNGKKVHSSKLVNTVYFAGTNVGTQTAIKIKDNCYDSEIITKLGDGTVPLYSAILDYPIDSRFVHIYDGYDHFDLGCKYVGPFAKDLEKAIFFMK
ncbi:MAG: hypothetical protein WCR54_05320 [Clostridia bacterium]